jgi:ferredoxin
LDRRICRRKNILFKGDAMNIQKVHTVFYSPTRTSFKICSAIAAGLGKPAGQEIDLTYARAGVQQTFGSDEAVVIAVPVYGGRVAPTALRRLAGIHGQATPAVIAVVYGNREFEDALVELYDVVIQAGFFVVGAGAFIGEHSYSTAEMPVAPGRPDGDDLVIARGFGAKIGNALAALQEAGLLRLAPLPGNRPYKDGVSSLPFGPQLDTAACTLCGSCVEACPVGAISLGDHLAIDVSLCTICCSCIKTCPEEALSISQTPARAKMEWLHTNCQARKEPQLFFAG